MTKEGMAMERRGPLDEEDCHTFLFFLLDGLFFFFIFNLKTHRSISGHVRDTKGLLAHCHWVVPVSHCNLETTKRSLFLLEQLVGRTAMF